MDNYNAIKSVYEKMCRVKSKYGVYRKTLFHLHTPASYDYKLFDNWKHEDYVKADDDLLIEHCVKNGIVPDRKYLDEKDLNGDYSQYSSKKEWLSYLLLAYKLVSNDYEIVVVSDHNSISGTEKLEFAVKDIHKIKSLHEYPEIMSGVEISCADKLHVVGIFDKDNSDRVQAWLDENLINEEQGTYKTSLDVIDFFKGELKGISYIAHINSASIFDADKFLSGAYKKRLKEAGCFEYIGVNEISNVETIKKMLSKHQIVSRGFVIDNDAHSVDTIDNNFFWIKEGKRSFKALKESFDDFEISVSLSNRTVLHKYIKCILVEKGGFLRGKDEEDFILAFSDSLNCFIGGRGTGKSTVLHILDYVIGLRVSDEYMLEYICKHGNIWVLFVDGEKEYLIRMLIPSMKKGDKNIMQCFGQNEANTYRYKYHFSEIDVKEYAVKNYLSIFEVIRGEQPEDIRLKSAPKYGTLSKLYDVRYSVNELVQTASSNQIDDFIRHLLFQNETLSSPEKTIKCRSKNGLAKAIQDMQNLMVKRRQEVQKVINPFNKKMNNVLRIVYLQNGIVEAPDFEKWLFPGKNASKRQGYNGLDITEENAVNYLYYVYREAGLVSLLKKALNEENRFQYDIADFFNNDRAFPNEKEKKEAIDTILDGLIAGDNYAQAIIYLRKMICESERFSLEFNINSRTTIMGSAEYKDVRTLSLGQKVVAMLDFIFGYGDFIGDNRPILIDQPEDNLDSQYIYKNLVQQLRDIKDKRQIIIATHNATIVTNAMADQVCVMCSDGKNGWIEKAGYPSEDRIKKDIVNYMEGGLDSFKHKMKVYESILK